MEKNDGMIAALQTGWVQNKIAGTRQARSKNFVAGKDILVGTNLHSDPQEIISKKIQPSMAYRVEKSRYQTREEHPVKNILQNLKPTTQPLMDSIIDSLLAGATVVEILECLPDASDVSIAPMTSSRAWEMVKSLI